MAATSQTERSTANAACSAASLWLVMMKAHRSIQGYVESTFASMGIGLSDFAILEVLLHKGPMSMSAIGSTVILANPSMTAAIARLERQGLVERTGCGSDRRVRTVRLSREGKRLIQELFAQHDRDLEALMADVGPAERAAARAVVKQVGLAAKAKTRGAQGS